MARIVVTQRLFPEPVERLRQAGHEVEARDSDAPPPREELIALARDADALITLLTDGVDGEVVGAGPRLGIVANVAVGHDNIDLAAAAAAGVRVTNTPGVLTEATADLAFALVLAAARRVVEGDRHVRAGAFDGWRLHQEQVGLDVHGRTLGIVGPGAIGRAVARRAALGFGMEVLYHGRSRLPAEVESSLAMRRVDLATLLATSDVVSLHAPLTPDTHHLIDGDALALMKPTAVLVNTSRGPLVDEAALARALAQGRLAGAGLDVYEDEPAVHPELLAQPRAVLLPHLGSATEATRRAMADLAVDNVLAHLTGAAPPHLVGAP